MFIYSWPTEEITEYFEGMQSKNSALSGFGFAVNVFVSGVRLTADMITTG